MKKLIIKLISMASIAFLSNFESDAQIYKAEQFTQTASIILNGNIEKVFPLFGYVLPSPVIRVTRPCAAGYRRQPRLLSWPGAT